MNRDPHYVFDTNTLVTQQFAGNQNGVHPYDENQTSGRDKTKVVKNSSPGLGDYVEVKVSGLKFYLHGISPCTYRYSA